MTSGAIITWLICLVTLAILAYMVFDFIRNEL